MLALDLFNTKYEQALQEGAIDNTTEHLLKPLHLRAANILTQLRSGHNTPEKVATLTKEYENLVAERMSILKGEHPESTNEMGYGSLGENDQIPVGRMQPGTPEYAAARNRSVKYAELTPDYTGGHKTAGPTTVGYKKATNKPLVPGEVEVAEAGLPGNLPPEQIPGKEDLLKGRGRQTYESQKKKSDPDLDSTTARDATVQRELQKLRGRHPSARSDIEALVKDEIVQQQQDAKAFGSIRNVNSKQDDLLKQIIALDKQQGDEINHLDQENSALEKELKDVEAVNDRLSQTVSSMTGTKQSTRSKSSSKSDKNTSTATPNYTAPGSTTTKQDNKADKETPNTSKALDRMASQLTTPTTVHNPGEKAAAKKASAADSAARNAFGAIANTSTINPNSEKDPNQPDLFNPTNKDRQRELPLGGSSNVSSFATARAKKDADTAQANRNYSGSNSAALDQPLPNTRGTGAAGAAVLHPNFGNNAYKALAKHHSADDLVSAPNDPYKTGTHSKNESQLNEFGDVIQMPGTQANAAELPGQQQATKIAISIVSLILRGDPTNQSPQLRNDLQRLGYRLRFDKPGIRLINDKYNKQVPIPINLFPRDVQQALAAPPEAVDETIEPGEEMSTNELLYRAAVEYMKHRGEAGQPVDYETAVKLAAKHYHIPYRPGMVPELHNKRVELDAKLDAAIRARQAERASRKQKQLARTAPTTPEQEKKMQDYWSKNAPQATRVKAPTRSLEEDQQLHVGDPIIVDYPNEFDGMTGEIIGFGQGNKFVIVRLYNHDEPVSMHSSDVKYNEYADDQDEKEFWNGDNEVNESDSLSDIDIERQDLELMNDRQFKVAYGISKVAFRQKYRALLNPAPQQDIPVKEGFQDFNKVEPYAVCLAGKPVKRFDYYEEARRFHDNWKKKLYREGDKAKADKITLMPLNLDEDVKTIKGAHGRLDVDTNTPGVTKVRQKDRLGAKTFTKDPYRVGGSRIGQKSPDTPRGSSLNSIGAYNRNPSGRIFPRLDHSDDSNQLAHYSAEAANPAQQAAIAIAMKKAGKKPKQADEAYTPSPAKPFRNPKGFNKQGTGWGNKLAQQTRDELAKKKQSGVAEDADHPHDRGMEDARAGKEYNDSMYSTHQDKESYRRGRIVAKQQAKKGVAEGKGLAKKVKIVKGPDAGKTGWIREVKHGAFKGAPKTYYIDLDDGGQANNLPATALRLVKEQGMAEGAGQQLSVQQLATVSDAALDSAYHYGRSQPGNTFGWQANLKSAAFAKQMIDRGVTDIEQISDAIHKGWNVTAQAFVKNPMMFDDSKTMAPEKLQAKIAQRQKLMTQQYAQLPEDEKEKDRVVARAMLQAITGGQQSVAEDTGSWIVYDPETRQIRKRFKTHTAGKSYAKVHGLGFASSEYYFDRVKDNKEVAETSPEKLARYKKAAGADATAADKRGDFERGNKRFKGIVRATNKEFDKGRAQGMAEGYTPDTNYSYTVVGNGKESQAYDSKEAARDAMRKLGAGYKIKRKPRTSARSVKKHFSNRNMELGEMHEPQKFIVTINGKSTSPLYADMADRLYAAAKRAQPNARIEKIVAPTTERQKGIDRVKAGYGDEDALELHEQLPSTPPANRKEYLDQRDKLFRMLAVDTNPVNKQIIKQALKDLDNRYGSIKNPVNEENSTSSEAVEIALIRRVLVAHTDLIMNFGLDKVTQAIEEVAYNVGDVDEIGTSDVSGWIHQVKQILGVE